MSSVSAIALSGLQAAQTRLGTGAHNIANLQTDGFRRQRVDASTRASGGVETVVARAPEPGHAMLTDMVGTLEAKHAYLANLAVFKADDQMQGALLDTLG